jgi:hypothetical protein
MAAGALLSGRWERPSLDAPADHVGIAAGLLRRFGSTASSIVTGIVFSHNVTGSGMQMLGR